MGADILLAEPDGDQSSHYTLVRVFSNMYSNLNNIDISVKYVMVHFCSANSSELLLTKSYTLS